MSILVQPVKNPMTKVSKILSLVALIAAFDSVSTRAMAQEAGEIAVRREEKAIVLRKTLEAAATAAKQGDLTSAAKAYEDAWNLTEELGSSVEKERNITIEGFTSTRLALAYNAAKAGEYKEADLQVKRILKVDPNHIKAKNFKRENDQRLANLVGRVPSDEALSYIGQDKTNKLAAAIAVQDGKLAFEMGHFDRAETKLQEAFENNLIVSDLRGMRVGQVNALTVYDFGDHAFVWDNVELSAKLGVGDIEICVEREFDNDGAHFSAGNIDITLANNSERSSCRAFAARSSARNRHHFHG